MGNRKLLLEQPTIRNFQIVQNWFKQVRLIISVVWNFRTTGSNNKKYHAHYSKSNKGGLVHEI